MMDYNSRMSQQFRYTQTSRNGSQQSSQNKQKKEDGDEFMRLPDKEIAGCISDIGVPFSTDDLLRPQPAQIQKVFEWFAELLMNTTRETVDPAMREACRDVCGEELIDIVPSETRNLMGFYASLRKLLSECGITDFSFSDLTKPTHPRLVKIFSYIINFVRFRESQTAAIDEHFNKLESTKTRIETLYVENQDLDARISSMQSERETMKSLVREKTARNDALKARLLELKKNQERIALEMESARGKKAALTQTLEERTERTVSLRQECEKLRPYASQSTPALQAHLAELSDSLSKDKQLLDLHEKRSRALQTSTDTFILTSNDITPCISLLNSVSSDLATEEQEAQEAAKRRDALAERGNNVREVERTEALLQRQLNRWLERTEAIRKQAVERNDAATERMKVLKGEHKVMVTERGEKGREVERRRVRIEQTEKKMADLKENIENEISAARDEYMKMDSHIKLYITEMEQAI